MRSLYVSAVYSTPHTWNKFIFRYYHNHLYFIIQQ
jgi:hypothetical protein